MSNNLKFLQQVVEFNFVFPVDKFQEQQFSKCLLAKCEAMVKPHISMIKSSL